MEEKKQKYEQLKGIYYSDREHYESFYFNRYNDSDTVRLGINTKGYGAFFVQCPEIFELVAKIYEKNMSIEKLSAEIPHQAINQFKIDSLIDEIVLTNEIEGINSTRKEIGEVLDKLSQDAVSGKKLRFEGLINKYFLLTSEVPLNSCEDIRELYNSLVLDEVVMEDPNNAPDGRLFRKDKAYVLGPLQETIHTGVFPEESIIEELTKSLDVLHNNDLNLLIRTALFHYLFGYIHPFYDGNGRTSRFISSYVLANYLNPLIGYRISYTIKMENASYYKAFKDCNNEKNRGDLTPFVITFLWILKLAFDNLEKALEKRKNLYLHYLEFAEHKFRPVLAEKDYEMLTLLLQGALFSKDGATKSMLKSLSGIKSNQTLEGRLGKIRTLRLLEENTIGKLKYYKIDLKKLES